MTDRKHSLQQWLPLITAVLCLISSWGSQAPLQAQVQAQSQIQANQPLIAQNVFDRLKWLFFPPKTANRGAPSGRRKGGATQGICPAIPANKQPLTALVPANRDGPKLEEIPMGATASAHPTFWFYVPYAAKSRRLAEFVLIDENEADVFSTTFTLTAAPGIIGVQAPEKILPLQVGKQYRWVFSVICDPSNRSGDVTVNGWIQRVALSATMQNQLQQTTLPSERFTLYAQSGVWYEALTTLANARLINPSDRIIQDWLSVLNSAGLNELRDEPITKPNVLLLPQDEQPPIRLRPI
jgi:hypothetical protein